MELKIKKPLIEKIIDDHLNIIGLSEQAKNYYRELISVSEILSFVNQRDNFSLMNTVNKITRAPSHTKDEGVEEFTLMIKEQALVAFTIAVKTLQVMENLGEESTLEEKTNFLIDLRNIKQPEYFQMIIADHYEDELAK